MSRLAIIEEELWTGGEASYRRLLAEEAVLVFADPVGAMNRDETLASIASAPRWTDVVLEEVREAVLAEDIVLLTYRDTARRPDLEEPYTARASSLYTRHGGDWKLAFHQQSA